MPTALVIEHDVYSPPGMIGEAAQACGYDLRPYVSRAGSDTPLPDPHGADIVIITGSEEHWHEIDAYPHLQRELAFIEAAIAADTPILGICFGGQGLALALGGDVEPSGGLEIGWIEIDTRNPGLVPPGPWLEWHYDRFRPPAGAEVLATTEFGVQAFRYGPHLGLQFHPEVNYEVLIHWEPDIPDHVDATEFVRLTKEHEVEARPRAYALFDTFLSLRQAKDHR